MNIVGETLLLTGVVSMLVGGAWCLFLAFRASIGWGFACIFIPFAYLVFAFKDLSKTGKPVIFFILGGLFAIVGQLILTR